MLQITELNYSRNDKPILQAVCLQLQSGQICLLRGPNGCGKTTLLRLIAGLITAHSGTIQNKFSKIAYLGHQAGIKLELSPLENAQYACDLANNSTAQLQTILQQVGLAAVATQPCQELSAGQRQRVGLACLLLQQAQLWILDEPGSNLDAAGHALLQTLIAQHCAAGGAVIMALHGDWPELQPQQQLFLQVAA